MGGLYFTDLDAKLFGQLAEAVDSEQLRTLFRWISKLIPALALAGGVLFFIGCVLTE